jgi:hypothetical protein
LPSLSFNHITTLTQDLFKSEKLLATFEETALEVFYYQYQHNKVYQRYCDLLSRTQPKSIPEIPFLPIETFKTHQVRTHDTEAELLFQSSGTTGMIPSTHFVQHAELYQASFLAAFKKFYGDPEKFCFLALLPSYLERGGSSLVYMVDDLIRRSQHPLSGFFLDEHDELERRLKEVEQEGQKTILIGVSYALLDFVEKRSLSLQHTTVMETGGMKGRKKEMPREELHTLLKAGFGVEQIHSEYGMTELLSQGYSSGDGIFETPDWMRIMIRESNDPFAYVEEGVSGGINIIDLANIYSCSFLQTQDLGKLHSAQRFEVLGRFDASDVRGCNLLIAQ